LISTTNSHEVINQIRSFRRRGRLELSFEKVSAKTKYASNVRSSSGPLQLMSSLTTLLINWF
jgi:hypothetical protein